jgi:glycosyltransferase involved in cell wall biosynthesis
VARIVMVNRPDEGGAFEHVAGLSRGIAAAGHEVIVCGPLADRADDLGVPVFPIEIERALSPREDPRAIGQLARAFRRLRPDLIHAHGSKGGVMARLARLATPRTPLVHTPHGYAFAGYFQSARSRAAFRTIERSLAPLTDREICVCEAEARLAATICAERKIRVVHNGIEPPATVEADPELLALRERGPLIGVVSGLRPGKGIETLIEAMPGLLARHPDATVALAGGGVERERLEALAASLQVDRSLKMLGEVADPYRVLAASDLFSFPSWAESFPYSILEAMAVGLPIVATDVGGVGEAIEDGETGLLVPARDPARLADAMARMIDDPGLASRLGAAAGKRLRDRFTLQRMVQKTLSVYSEFGLRPGNSL